MKKLTRITRLALALGLSLTSHLHAQLLLQKNDTVGIVGNALADRMQHDGWVEAVIQAHSAGQNLVFRNLAVSGDTITSRPRTKGVPSPDDMLAHCKADVVFAFFGYNESFAGAAGLTKFKADLAAMVVKYQAAKFNGESAPRIVLFLSLIHI